MSNKEQCIRIIEALDEAQAANAAAMLKAFLNGLEEAADDAYCMNLYREFAALPEEEKGEPMRLEDFAACLEERADELPH